MTTNFELTSGKNRALVYYCDSNGKEIFNAKDAIKAVFDAHGITYDDASDVMLYPFPSIVTPLEITLKYADKAKKIKVNGRINDVCIGVFFYNAPQPIDTRGTMAEVNEFFGEDIAPEPPSITSLVCDDLRENFGGVYGASAFVIPNDITSYTLEVE